ncbi:hypothetical protein [Candidatus Nitrospira neomarina]|uniref:Uncharacterized protein n=1 Tax=Candidatus Nitrospira neomarina TaxID=3020899 RepID=A0AA96GJN1_9BACT|nr:hypothetical protein [Candidatus Nitrospira neomarina]WNM62557.1 hypothetical protein PQG83_02080 [Candidatus Nitrospira neomarina]
MRRHHKNQQQSNKNFRWYVPLLFLAMVGCQDETAPVNNPPVEPTVSGNSQEIPPPPVDSNTANPSSTDQPSEHARLVVGEVMSIDDKTYMIKDSENKEIRVETTSMTLVDEGIEVGDTAEIRYSAEEKPTAIRKVRGT